MFCDKCYILHNPNKPYKTSLQLLLFLFRIGTYATAILSRKAEFFTSLFVRHDIRLSIILILSFLLTVCYNAINIFGIRIAFFILHKYRGKEEKLYFIQKEQYDEKICSYCRGIWYTRVRT